MPSVPPIAVNEAMSGQAHGNPSTPVPQSALGQGHAARLDSRTPCNPQCVGTHPKLKAGTIRNTTIQQAQYKNTTSATQEHDNRNTRTQTSAVQQR
jgi:hypothetical protein